MTPPSGPTAVESPVRPLKSGEPGGSGQSGGRTGEAQRAAQPKADGGAERATLGGVRKSGWEQFALGVLIMVPFAALIAAIPVMWGWGLGWHDVVIAAVMYAISGHGVTIGYHRLFTHRAFKANRWLRVSLAFAGGMAIEGPVVRWVADHRRHHAFSDRDGDPHSPWRFGDSFGALTKGLLWAHVGWLFDPEQTDATRYAPDLIADRDVVRVSRLFWLQAMLSLLLPPLIGGLWSMSIAGALDRLLLGRAGAGVVASSRDLVGQLDLPRGWPAAVPQPRQVRQRVVARDLLDGRVMAQPAPRRPDLRAPRRASRAARLQRTGDLAVREVRLGA